MRNTIVLIGALLLLVNAAFFYQDLNDFQKEIEQVRATALNFEGIDQSSAIKLHLIEAKGHFASKETRFYVFTGITIALVLLLCFAVKPKATKD